eukprot:CAMPEP_0194139376 /NCGR_PEP_ID=MMETSP0152-20130528/9020_1 /TAXON_ID=1049557 /ORGANISM="Thalassiothrix antarctica, Strain L6-D1" /LENGTH=30 /DNA_ID= /DNA_START= /DNA_END= /DNA_ORIENTATION=
MLSFIEDIQTNYGHKWALDRSLVLPNDDFN